MTRRGRPSLERDSFEHLDLSRPLVDPSTEGALELGRLYWDELERSTAGLVRARRDGAGVRLVVGRLLTLLRFGEPQLEVGADEVGGRYPILGGLLASRPGGFLAVAQRGVAAPRLEVAVEGYRPALSEGVRCPIEASSTERCRHRSIAP